MHWIGIGLVVAVLGSGSLSRWFGLVGVHVSEATRLTSCLERHHIDVGSLVATVGDPVALLSGTAGRSGERAVRVAEKHGRLESREATAVIGCVRAVAR